MDALSGIDLVVEEGTVFGFLGPNGAGKTTTMHILLGFVEPTGGEVGAAGAEGAGERTDSDDENGGGADAAGVGAVDEES